MIRPLLVLAIGAVLACLAIGRMLSRIDRAHAEAAAARAEVAELAAHSHPAPPVADFTAELELCRVRTQHLRSTMEVLILAGTRWPMFVKLPEGPHTGWPPWPMRGWDLKHEAMRDTGPGALAKGLP